MRFCAFLLATLLFGFQLQVCPRVSFQLCYTVIGVHAWAVRLIIKHLELMCWPHVINCAESAFAGVLVFYYVTGRMGRHLLRRHGPTRFGCLEVPTQLTQVGPACQFGMTDKSAITDAEVPLSYESGTM